MYKESPQTFKPELYPESKEPYTEFTAWHRTLPTNIDNIRDSDECSVLLQKYSASNPPDGWLRLYYENGNLRYEWDYKDGKVVGVSQSWWPCGQTKSIRNWKNGVWHGLLKSWYEFGMVASTRNFKNGKKDGLSTDWYKNGQVWSEITHENGKLISEKYWNRDGSVSNKSCHKKGELKQYRKINPNY